MGSQKSLQRFGVIYLFSCLCLVQLAAQTPALERLGAAEGLSQGMIYDLLQDQKGFLWFATKDGLNRYDGYTFQVYQNNPFDPFSISDNEIQCLLEDQLGRIWTGTSNNGLNVLDLKTGRFYHLNKLSGQNILNLAQTTDGSIWASSNLGTTRIQLPDALSPSEPDLGSFARVDTFYWDDPKIQSNAPLNNTVDLEGSRDGKLWVSTVRQIGYYEPQTGLFQNVWTNPQSDKNDFIASYFKEAPDGSMWVGQPGQLLRLRGTEVSVFPLPERSVFPYTRIVFDTHGNLFVGTRKQIFKLPAAMTANPANARFELFYRFPEEGIIGTTKLLIDRNGLLWIGTNGYGLRKYTPGNPNFKHYLVGKSPRRILTESSGRTWVWQTGSIFRQLLDTGDKIGPALFTDDSFIQHDAVQTGNGKLWLLCEKRSGNPYEGVLFRLNPQTLRPEASFPLPIKIGMFSRLFLAADGKLWVLGNQSAISCFDPASARFDAYDFSEITGFKEIALGLSIAANGHLWIGTPHGLVHGILLDQKINFVLHKNNPADQNTINCNNILSMQEDPLQPELFLWLGTKGGGLNRLNKQTGVFQHHTNKEGLPNNVVYGILADAAGNLWLSTNCGLSKFEPKTGVFQNFFSVDGLQDNEFNTLSFAKAADGRLYFGGVNGITAFYPESITASFQAPPVYINRLKINNLLALIGDGVLNKSIEYTDFITLSYQQNQLTFEFAAMDFSAPRMNQFKYRLIGADETWVEPSTFNSATYAHLAPGNYTFELMSGGTRGIWNGAVRSLKIRILPPWWRSNWAYLGYFLILFLSAWTFYRFQIGRIRLENKLAFEHREAVRLAELDRLKTDFFNSITHEFKTPLTLLIEPARQLLNEIKDQTSRFKLELIEKNARRLLRFVNQLLELSKLEAGQMPLDLRPGKPAETVRTIVEQFQALAQQLNLQLSLDLPENNALVLFDESKWEHILSNLLSNALKFTKKDGRIAIKLQQSAHEGNAPILFTLSVSDTGIGIPEQELSSIFDRFYQSRERGQVHQDRALGAGSGIGLALCKELVERMEGAIRVQSPGPNGAGAVFRVEIPCAPTLLNTPENIPEKAVVGAPEPVYETALENPPINPNLTAPLLLLIEDDHDLRQLLRASMPPYFRIAEASNGEEGIQMARELIPDLIISDLVMPLADGYAVVETLKKDPGVSHIPIILLTAKSGLESKLQGLQRGADVYLSKPFNADELLAHIRNLLASRQRLQELFSQPTPVKTVVETAVAALPQEENEFLQRVIQVLETHLENDDLDADGFARAVFISRSQLHRKINALTGLSLTEFARNYRLDRAREMLTQRKGSISEVAWRTGFPNPKYFSTCFKERFGVTPSGFVAGG